MMLRMLRLARLLGKIHCELHLGHRFLERCVTNGTKRGKLAIITYRIAADSIMAVTTASTSTLLAVIEAATQHDVEYIWLDCWAYRRQPPWAEYDHEHFCASLACVMNLVGAPRCPPK